MLVYNQYEDTVTHVPDPIEQDSQIIPAHQGRSPLADELAQKMPHLSLSAILFIAAVVNIEDRRYGVITRLANFYQISRVSVYALSRRVLARLSPGPCLLPRGELGQGQGGKATTVIVNKRRIERVILASTFPGNVSIRPTQVIMQEALECSRSVGYINTLRREAGRRAGELLSQVEYSSLGSVICLRDETFYQGRPILILLDPLSSTILAAHVCADRQAETWAIALLMAQSQGVSIEGMVEDMAKIYDKSLLLAQIEEKLSQKDTWHIGRDGATVRRALERAAYGAMNGVIVLEQKLLKKWDEALFEQEYIAAVSQERMIIQQHDAFEMWLDHFHDALTLVDIHNGDIRDLPTNQWLLEEVLGGMEQIDHRRVKKFTTTVRNHQKQLLTFLTWTATALAQYQTQLTPDIPSAPAREQFIRAVARSWRLDQALINGHRQWKGAAQKAATLVKAVTDTSTVLADFALNLRNILDASGRTSSLIESINSLLKSFFKNRKGFKSQATMQAYLDLFTLWHNTRVYDSRCKRGGKSPFQLAGIDLGSDDWLTLLGYPPLS